MNKQKEFTRRKFLGMSALGTAALLGTSVIGLPGCKKESTTLYGEETEAVVIGSGFGGAISSLRLTEKGIKTTLLEMGKQYDINNGQNKVFASTLKPDTRSTWMRSESVLPLGPKLRWSGKGPGVLDRVEYENMKVYRGTCLGGGSVVYGAMLPQAQEDLFQNLFPNIPYSELNDKWYPMVRNIIGISTVPQDILDSKYYQYARVGLQHAENAGFGKFFIPGGVNFDIIRQEIHGTVEKAITNQDLLYGVNNGAKNSVDRNYIPAALGTGNLTIQTLTKVENVTKLDDGRFEVLVTKLDERGIARSQKTIICKYLFVCAGSVGSNEILVKARETGNLPDLSLKVGKNWGFNGNAMAMRKVNQNVGAQQGTVPVTGYVYNDNPLGKTLVEQAPYPIGLELKSLLGLAVTLNENKGSFEYDNTLGKAMLKLSANATEPSIESMRNFLNRVIDANGGEIDYKAFKNGISNDFTYHPLGGVVLGEASDMYGRVNGYKNLYCVDGSMLPGLCGGVNPALTISALAERCLDNIVKNDFN